MANFDYINTVRNINKIARLYYPKDKENYDHDAYLEACFECLYNFFQIELAKEYLFSALTKKNRGTGKIEVVRNNDSDTGYHFVNQFYKESLEPTIEKLIKDIDKNSCLSLTQTLLNDQTNGKDVFFFSKQGYPQPVKSVSQNKDARVIFYPLSSLTLDFIEQDASDFIKKNSAGIGLFENLLTADDWDIPAHNSEGTGKLLWYYKQLQEKFESLSDNSNKNFIVHFIRPSFIEFDYNILLSLTTNETLKPFQLSFIYLLIYRIVSQTAIEKTKETEKIELLKHISISTHAIKTGINGLLSPPLNSLMTSSEFENDTRIKNLDKARDKILSFTEIINLMSKLSSKRLNESELRSALIQSNLFSENKKDYALSSRLYEIINLWKEDKSLTEIEPPENLDIIIKPNNFEYGDLSPTESFYDLLLLTILENCVKYGFVGVNSSKVLLHIDFKPNEKLIVFRNRPKNQKKMELTYQNSTGNIKLFFTLFNKLDLGEFTGSCDEEFFIKIRSN